MSKDTGAIASDLRDGAEALKSWFDSMSEQRSGWGYQHGVEANARDALEGAYRLATTVYQLLGKTAEALDLLTQAIEARSGETEGEGS